MADLDPIDLCPDQTDTVTEFVGLLGQLRQRSGYTYRELERRAAERGDLLPRSTIADVLRRSALPREDLLGTFVRACGAEDQMDRWLRTRDRLAKASGSTPIDPRDHLSAPELPPSKDPQSVPPFRRLPMSPVRLGLISLGLSLLLIAAGLGLPFGENDWSTWRGQDDSAVGLPPGSALTGTNASTARTGTPPAAATVEGWVRIRPVTAPALCLTDGRVLNRRYTPLVAVQRPCDEVAPQNTFLEHIRDDMYRIQWHHPDYGKGCLMILMDGPGAGLLEPWDDCERGSYFHVEPSGPYGDNRYVFRVDGQGCVGIKNSDTSEGVEAVTGRCVGRGGQVFFIEPAS